MSISFESWEALLDNKQITELGLFWSDIFHLLNPANVQKEETKSQSVGFCFRQYLSHTDDKTILMPT